MQNPPHATTAQRRERPYRRFSKYSTTLIIAVIRSHILADEDENQSSSEEGEWLEEDSEYDDDSYEEDSDSEREDSEDDESEEEDTHSSNSDPTDEHEYRFLTQFADQGLTGTKRKASLSPGVEDVIGQPPRKYRGYLRARSAPMDTPPSTPLGEY